MADAIRWRKVGGVLISYFEPGGRPSDELIERWHAALTGVEVCLIASLGAIEPSASHRRATTKILIERRIRVVIVSDDRVNRALAKLLGWMGVSVKSCAWSQLDELSEELVGAEQAGSLTRALAGLREQGAIRLARTEGT
jgi:hypothetical protein